MSAITLAIDSVLVLAMVGVSRYGAATLPAGAQVPMHFGPTGFNHWVSRGVGLLMWPAGGVLIYVILVVVARSQQADGGSGPPVGFTVALAVILVNQAGALWVARSHSDRT